MFLQTFLLNSAFHKSLVSFENMKLQKQITEKACIGLEEAVDLILLTMTSVNSNVCCFLDSLFIFLLLL